MCSAQLARITRNMWLFRHSTLVSPQVWGGLSLPTSPSASNRHIGWFPKENWFCVVLPWISSASYHMTLQSSGGLIWGHSQSNLCLVFGPQSHSQEVWWKKGMLLLSSIIFNANKITLHLQPWVVAQIFFGAKHRGRWLHICVFWVGWLYTSQEEASQTADWCYEGWCICNG